MEERSTLTVLETLSADSNIHQRKIAAQTGLNLAKVNFVLKKLVDKGFVKLKRVKDNPHKRRYLYLLTPAGVAEKSRLTYRFLKRTLKKYEEAERKVIDCVESMLAQGVNKVVLWGNTEITELCMRVLGRMDGGVEVIGVVDPAGIHPRSIHPSRIRTMDIDAIFLCDTDSPDMPIDIPVWKLT
ncbi:MarR family EPS-associated transcriptional regulator [Myxococcota bacterium]